MIKLPYPKLKKDKNYFYDVMNNTIHYKEKYSFNYYHELSHWKDYQNKIYRKISSSLSITTQGSFQIIGIMLVFALFPLPIPLLKYVESVAMIGLGLLIIPIIWTNQEEIRADLYAMYRRYKDKKELGVK